MKIRHIFLTLTLLGLLSGCRVPFAPVTPTPIPTASFTATPRPSETPTITLTPFPSRTRRPTETSTASRTPRSTGTISPTPTSIYPIHHGTPLPDGGFAHITTANADKLTLVYQLVRENIWSTTTSRDGKLLFVATNRGIYVYDRQGLEVAHWSDIQLPGRACEGCISVNTDGSRFAIMTHKDAKWLARVYNVFENTATLLLEKPIEVAFQGIPNEVSVALSPDGLLLAYGTAEGNTLLIDMNSNQVLLTNGGGTTSAVFSPDGRYFMIRHGIQLLVWKTPTWRNPTNLQLPSSDATYTFSADGKRLAIAQTDKITAYDLDTLRPNREISISTPADLKRDWQIVFLDENILSGYTTRWNSDHTKATIDVGQWNLATGETIQFGTHETDSPDGLAALWGVNLPALAPFPTDIPLASEYDKFGFVDQNKLLINSAHSACWLTLAFGTQECFNDPKNRILASNTQAYREFRSDRITNLLDWGGYPIAQLDQPYPFIILDSDADTRFVNVKDITTDLYRGKNNRLENSFPGILLNVAENAERMALTLKLKSSGMTITMWGIASQQSIYLKNVDFILKPLLIDNLNNVYFLQQNIGSQGVVLKTIPATNEKITDLAVLPIPLPPTSMTRSDAGVFALGTKDGSVTIVSPNGLELRSFQAAYTPISGVAFTLDGHYLAVMSDDGLRVFAVMP